MEAGRTPRRAYSSYNITGLNFIAYRDIYVCKMTVAAYIVLSVVCMLNIHIVSEIKAPAAGAVAGFSIVIRAGGICFYDWFPTLTQ